VTKGEWGTLTGRCFGDRLGRLGKSQWAFNFGGKRGGFQQLQHLAILCELKGQGRGRTLGKKVIL